MRGTNGSPPRKETPESIMLVEHSHRIANDLTVVIAALELCKGRLQDASSRDVVAAALDRLHVVCIVQRRLMRPEKGDVDLGLFLQDLAEAVVRARSEPSQVRLSLHLKPLNADSHFAWRLGAIVAELLTNALKHGIAARRGRISVLLEEHGDRLCCMVVDEGTGAGDWRGGGGGRGTAIVAALVDDLCGTVERWTSTAGTGVRLTFPMAVAASRSEPIPARPAVPAATASVALCGLD